MQKSQSQQRVRIKSWKYNFKFRSTNLIKECNSNCPQGFRCVHNLIALHDMKVAKVTQLIALK